jgi:multisubunit Na+/H+ antiporter MnhB subunit
VNSVILQAATRLLAGLMLVFAVYLLFRGHNAPGGGFSGALVAGTAFALFAVVEGPGAVRSAVRIPPRVLTATGLAVALLSGLAGPAAGRDFMAGLWWSLPGDPGKVAAGTPLVFDIGVFLTVLGAVLAILLALEES